MCLYQDGSPRQCAKPSQRWDVWQMSTPGQKTASVATLRTVAYDARGSMATRTGLYSVPPAPTAGANRPSHIAAADLIHHHAHLLEHGERTYDERFGLMLLGQSGRQFLWFLGVRPTPTSPQASSGGPPPRIRRAPRQPQRRSPDHAGNAGTSVDQPKTRRSCKFRTTGVDDATFG